MPRFTLRLNNSPSVSENKQCRVGASLSAEHGKRSTCNRRLFARKSRVRSLHLNGCHSAQTLSWETVKGALMQTLHLRYRDLRAILLGGTPTRWLTPSMPQASTWETASPLPNPLGPTLAVGAHPKTSHQRLDRCPIVGACLTMVSLFREPRVCGAITPDTRLVCWSQTAENTPYPAAPQMAGQGMGYSLQAPFSEVLRTPSNGLYFSLRPQHSGARACGKNTADRTANDVTLARVSSRACWRRLRLCSVAC